MMRPPRTAHLAAALISAVAVMVLTLCTTLFLRSYRNAIVEAARTNSAQAVSQVVGAVGNYVNTMESAVTIVMGHLDDAEEPRDAFLGAFLTARPEVAAITAYDADGALLNCWAQDGRTPKEAILRNLSFDLTTARRLSQGYISTPHVESIFAGYYPWVVSVVRTVPGTAEKRWLSLDLSFTELAATISNVGIGQHGYCYLMDERGNMVYHPQQQLLYAGLKKEEAGRLACLGDGTYVEDTVIYSVQRVPNSPWRVVGVSYIDETVNESFWQMVRIAVATAALIFVAALVVGWVLSRLLSRPLQQLENAMEAFEQDADHFVFCAVRGTREVQNLSDSFGHMVGRIQRLMTTVREEEIVLRKTELKALQAQINPHFLYNTLESIRGEALLSGMDTIADMTEALATFFRYTISKVENLVSVEEELQNCETYFHIQRYRFADRLELHISCDPADREAIYRCRLPKLTIQPIVENSIIHGTELKLGTGHIRIQLERTQKRLLIRISDDGVGMDAETLFRLNERLGKSAIAQPPQSRGGLALANVDSRIRLLFGDKYGLHAFSTPGVGTDVEITLPMIASDRDIPNREALV